MHKLWSVELVKCRNWIWLLSLRSRFDFGFLFRRRFLEWRMDAWVRRDENTLRQAEQKMKRTRRRRRFVRIGEHFSTINKDINIKRCWEISCGLIITFTVHTVTKDSPDTRETWRLNFYLSFSLVSRVSTPSEVEKISKEAEKSAVTKYYDLLFFQQHSNLPSRNHFYIVFYSTILSLLRLHLRLRFVDVFSVLFLNLNWNIRKIQSWLLAERWLSCFIEFSQNTPQSSPKKWCEGETHNF